MQRIVNSANFFRFIEELQTIHSQNNFQVKVVCETRGTEHKEELRNLIAATYREWYFTGDNDNYPISKTPSPRTIIPDDKDNDDNVSH